MWTGLDLEIELIMETNQVGSAPLHPKERKKSCSRIYSLAEAVLIRERERERER